MRVLIFSQPVIDTIWKEMSRGHHTGREKFKTRQASKVKKNMDKAWKRVIFATSIHPKLKK